MDGQKLRDAEYVFGAVGKGDDDYWTSDISSKYASKGSLKEHRGDIALIGAAVAWPGKEISIISKDLKNDILKKYKIDPSKIVFRNEKKDVIDVRIKGNVIKAALSKDFKDVTHGEVYAYIEGVSREECVKKDKLINEIFGGYAKFEKSIDDYNDVCVTTWYPSFEKNNSVNRDFDKAGFGTDYMFFVNDGKDMINFDDGNETYEKIIASYLQEKARESGKILTNIHCNPSLGKYKNAKEGKRTQKEVLKETPKNEKNPKIIYGIVSRAINGNYKYIRCYGTYNNKVLTEDFMVYDFYGSN